MQTISATELARNTREILDRVTSVISLGELGFGVQSCPDPTERAMRAAYLRQVESRPTLSVSQHTAAAFGVLAAAVKQAGRSPTAALQRSVDSCTGYRTQLRAVDTQYK